MSALRDKRFRRLLFGEAVSGFGDSALYLSLGVWVKDLTGSNARAGLVFLCIALPGLLAPAAGHVVDRTGRRKLMIWLYSVMALVVLSLLLVHDRRQLWIIYLVALAYGAASTFPARSGLLKDMLSDSDTAGAIGLLQAATQGLRIVSPAVGTAVYAAWGGGTLAVIDAATFGVAVLALSGLRVTESAPEAEGESLLRQVSAGFRHLHRTALLRRLTLAVIVLWVTVGFYDSSTFAAIAQGLHRRSAFFGVVMSAQGAGSLVGALPAGRLTRRLGEARAAGVGFALVGVSAAMATTTALPTYLAGAALLGFGLAIAVVAVFTALQVHTPSRLQGRTSGALDTMMTATQTGSIAVGAALVGILDYRLMFAAIACAAAVSAVGVVVPSGDGGRDRRGRFAFAARRAGGVVPGVEAEAEVGSEGGKRRWGRRTGAPVP
ncbi:MAG TPA: MFS transporter [Actinocrinis sp.]|nr:MFS transporter [Actinocrinis sp.]